MSINKMDAAAVGLSSLCIIHCLGLPLLVSFLPLLGPASEAEWVHQALVLFAVPIAVVSLFRTEQIQTRWIFGFIALAGSVLLILGAFVEALHDYETALTVFGALLLATGHIIRWQSHQMR